MAKLRKYNDEGGQPCSCSDDSKKNLLWRTRSALSGASCLSHHTAPLPLYSRPTNLHCHFLSSSAGDTTAQNWRRGQFLLCKILYYNLFVISLRPSCPLLWHRTSQRRRSEYPRGSKQTRQFFFSGPYRSPLRVSNMQQSAPYLRIMP